MTIWVAFTIVLPSAIWLVGVLSWRYGRRSGKEGSAVSASSVVVARNEEATIGDCLLSLSAQSVRLHEIVLYDDGSTDRTRVIAGEIARQDERVEIRDVILMNGARSAKKSALADAFIRTKADCVALTDADCAAPNRWIEEMVHALDDSAGAVIGASWPEKSDDLIDHIYRAERLVANTLMASACGWGSPASACGHNILYRTAALLAVDGPVHRELPAGDDDLTVQAIAKSNWRVVFCKSPDGVVRDLGGVRGSRLAQAARHQSVTHLYPLHWRILFVFSVLANVVSLVLVAGIAMAGIDFSMLAAVAAKIALDVISGAILASKLRLNIGLFGIIAAAVFLPIWSLWRAVAALFKSRFEWRGRQVDIAIGASDGNGI